MRAARTARIGAWSMILAVSVALSACSLPLDVLGGQSSPSADDPSAHTSSPQTDAPTPPDGTGVTPSDPPPGPVAGEDPTASGPAPRPSSGGEITREVCSSLHAQAVTTITDGWDLIIASRGVADSHGDMVGGMVMTLGSISADTDSTCLGSHELDDLEAAIAGLRAAVGSSAEAAESDYEAAADAGNELLKVVGNGRYTFTTTYSE